MARRDDPLQTIPDPHVRAVLGRLHAQADRETPRVFLRFADQIPRLLLGRRIRWDAPHVGSRLDDAFIALDRTQGAFCYLLARALGARRVVEFGTSFGVSTLWLACAVRDNGGGRVIGTERVPAKAARARQHLREAGLEAQVEIREGDARETLRELDGPIDLLLNDGFPPYALPVLQLVAAPRGRGAARGSAHQGAFWADYRAYLRWVRDPANGFASGLLAMNEGTELSVRVA
jgi:predicted O-methyltransferase YrrM